MRRLAPRLFALALIAALSGCSVATQNSATPLPSSFALGPTSTTTSLPTQEAHQLKAYFLKGGRLFAVEEPYSTDPLGAALEALDIGPSADETARGITTAFSESPAQITSAGPLTKDGTVFIKVDNEFTSLPGEALEQAFAQIVFTVMGLPDGPSSVQFLYLGYHLDALIPPGQLVARPVTRSDYCAFAPTTYIPCQKDTGTVGIS